MMSNRVPAGDNDFIQVQAYHDIYEKLSDTHASAVTFILTGTSGVGKTEIALQVMKHFETGRPRQDQNNVLTAQFNCDSVPNLVADLRQFAESRDLHLSALRNGDSDLKEVFAQFYHEVETNFPDHLKCFIFDDAEKPTQVVRHIDQSICSKLQMDRDRRMRWKVLVTTQDAGREDWIYGCNHITSDSFIQIDGFSEDETVQFFKTDQGGLLNEDEIREVRANLGDLPFSLQVVRFEIRRNKLSDTGPFLRRYLDGINKYHLKFNLDNKAIAALHLSLTRLTEQSSRSAECQELIKLLTLADEKNFTTEMLVSFAEVIHPRNGNQTGYALANDLIDDMVKRSLCEEPRKACGTWLVSFHKLVKQSMTTLFRMPYNVDSEISLVRKALLGLTRVIPKDGRMHQSNSLFGFLFNHGRALEVVIDTLRTQKDINRDGTPCIMLMYVNLLMAMGYCQLACRVPAEHAIGYLEKAMDVYSELMTGDKYDDLRGLDPNMPAASQKAEMLFRASETSPLLHDQYYKKMIKDIPQYRRLTPKDLRFMLDEGNSDDWDLTYGHLDELQLLELKNQGKVLDADDMRLFYPMELLAELYSLWSKARGFHGESAQLTGKCVECANAALVLYRRIKQDYQVTLVAEVITRRELLKIYLNMSEDQLSEIAQCRDQPSFFVNIESDWRELKQRRDKAFEYGLMRTNFGKDNYNKFLCQEGLADCLGRRSQMVQDPSEREALYKEGKELFEGLIERSKTEEFNLQTTSKSHRHYAEFLKRCGKIADAIPSLIDAMECLNRFLRKKEQSEFPEQQESCGKFKPLHNLLKQYWEEFKQVDSREPVLRTDGTDAHRFNYLNRFVKAWKKNEYAVQAGGNEKFLVMEEILRDCGMDTVRLTNG